MPKKKEQRDVREVAGFITGYFSWFAPRKVSVFINRVTGKADGEHLRPPKIKASVIVQTADQRFTINCERLDEKLDQEEIQNVPKAVWKTVDEGIRETYPIHKEVTLRLVTTEREDHTYTRAYLKE